MSMLLQMHEVVAGYGPLTVLNHLNLSLATNSRTALVGRNGVGKSTTLKAVMGLAQVRAGRIVFDGQDITQLPPHERAQLGLGYVPQTRDIFSSLSVEENLIAGLKRRARGALEEAYALFPRLKERRRNAGNHLSGGEQQMLSVARALLGQPRLLLLDEPLEGLSPLIRQELLHAFKALTADGALSVVIVEQQVHEALGFAHDALIMDHGAIVHAGSSQALLQSPDILDRHVGVAVS
ncbi:ABC transporter ATP-binding protein [Azohydromonas australica]|uniref:ABC transporter ATP-binding protein n=1 Tax=Azohydromonas australica TaxID=364039 RepID=UPI00041A6514|nr:ABC transporter ATP-binding protein [Azohydromonas australica]